MKISKDAIKGIIFCGCLVIAWILHKNYCKCPVQKPESEFYEREIKEKDSIILERDKTISKREKHDSVKYETIYKDRIIYKTIYEKIPYSNSVERDSAFDTLLSK